jgi:hypothetical protein
MSDVTKDPRALVPRHMAEIREAFAPMLAAKLGRPVETLARDGLRAGDFSLDAAVRVTLCDGSTMELRYAFVVIDEARGALGIFSEHCGYFVHATVDLTVEELRHGEVHAVHRF